MRTLGDVMRMPKRVTTPPPAKADMSSAVSGIRGSRSDAKRRKRVEAGRHDIKQFALTYLSHHFEDKFCELHDDIFGACNKSAEGPVGLRYARIAPRKFGKTTVISLAKVLHALAYQTHHFILLIGESAPAAEANLATVAQELDSNDQLLEDFPHLRPARDTKNQFVKWTDRQIVITSLATVMAKGMGTRMRGIKYRQMRPDLGIIDDPESPETADTFLKRRRHKRWFGGTFMGLAAAKWDLYVIGNLPHHDCLIADLVKDKKWDGKLYRAINIPMRGDERYPIGNTKTDGSPLWPEVWDHEALNKYKREPNVGMLGFSREMMNDPRSEEEKVFDVSTFSFFDSPFPGGVISPSGHVLPELARALSQTYASIAIAVDPAGGEKPGDVRRGVRDWCCVVVAGRTRIGGFIDVLDVWMTKQVPEKQISGILDYYNKWKARQVVAEENMYKNLYAPSIAKMARERRLYPSIRTINSNQNKVSRILGTQPLIHPAEGGSATIRFARHLFEKVPEYFVQFDEFPTAHDDGPDATEIVVRALEKGRPVGLPTSTGSAPSYWRSAA